MGSPARVCGLCLHRTVARHPVGVCSVCRNGRCDKHLVWDPATASMVCTKCLRARRKVKGKVLVVK